MYEKLMTEIGSMKSQDDERFCLHCQKSKPLTVFDQYKRKMGEYRKICRECKHFKQSEQHRRVNAQRNAWRKQQEREERRKQEWERRSTLLKTHEERWRERELWHFQQPERCCRTCRRILPASDFGGTSSANGFILHVQCRICHDILQKRHQLACCLCQEKIPRRDFLSHYDGYALHGDDTALPLCCKGCEASFSALSTVEQRMWIQYCCQITFPVGQVIYAEIDPETSAIRYIGRTSNPKRRHAQHLCDASSTITWWGSERKPWYTRGNWIQTLADKGLTPFMQILQTIDVSPLVVEWEQRYIWHGIQQGWMLLNSEAMDEELVARVQASRLHFLETPFEILVEERFFSSHGFISFLHEWYQSV